MDTLDEYLIYIVLDPCENRVQVFSESPELEYPPATLPRWIGFTTNMKLDESSKERLHQRDPLLSPFEPSAYYLIKEDKFNGKVWKSLKNYFKFYFGVDLSKVPGIFEYKEKIFGRLDRWKAKIHLNFKTGYIKYLDGTMLSFYRTELEGSLFPESFSAYFGRKDVMDSGVISEIKKFIGEYFHLTDEEVTEIFSDDLFKNLF